MAYYLEENEKWVKGLSRYYSVTDMGDWFSHHYDSKIHRSYKKRALKNGSFGATVQCSYNGRSKTLNVAVAMYEAWIRPLEDDEILMPVNGDATDMRLENMMPVKKTAKEKMRPTGNVRRGRRPKEYLLENVITGKLICYTGIAGAKKYGLNGALVSKLTSEATAYGRDYITMESIDYRFIVAVAA